MVNELRKTPRRKSEQLVYVEFGRENGGMMRDLSENGMGFRSVGPLQHRENIPFSFSFNAGEPLTGEAQLVWTDEDGRAGGLLFVNVSEEVRRQIRDWCALGAHPPVNASTSGGETSREASTFEELRAELRSGIAPAAEQTPSAIAEMAVQTLFQTKDEESPLVSPENPAESVPPERALLEMPPDQAATAPIAAEPLSPLPPAPLQPAPLSLERDIDSGLQPLTPLQGTLTETKWGENVTIGWVVVAMVVLTLVAAGIVFHYEIGQSIIWLGAKIVGPDHTAAPQVQPPAAPAEPEASSDADRSDQASSPPTTVPNTGDTDNPVKSEIGSEKQKPQPAQPDSRPEAANTPSGTRTHGREATLSTETSPANVGSQAGSEPLNSVDSGQTALQQAQQVLRGGRGSSDVSEAVRLLWIAVERGNSDAEVVLADLYRTGEGVTQSCDQTRVLLTAAAKKGNNEAKSRLTEIALTGCP